MPLGSSSEAPVINPGPSAFRRRGLLCPTIGLGDAGLSAGLELTAGAPIRQVSQPQRRMLFRVPPIAEWDTPHLPHQRLGSDEIRSGVQSRL